jgi:glutamate-1-semialdehyde 2,1-aminomutase
MAVHSDDSGPRTSTTWHARALAVMPDGIAGYSQLRQPAPLYLARAAGARVFDLAGRGYLDYMLGAGPLVLGHRHPAVVTAIEGALARAVPNVGVTTDQVELAELLCEHVPSLQQVRFLPTGTEAVQAAIRVARRATGRKLIAKFEGAYHGQSENVMVSVAAPAAERGTDTAPNQVPYHCAMPDEIRDLTVVLPFNNLATTAQLIERHAADLAVVLVEPMLGFAGAIPATPEYLRGLRELTARLGIVLVFDEVITGFRLATGGGQAHYGVTPDMCVLGKAIGGGMPLAAFGGRRELMDWVAVHRHPDDYVFQSGTFSAFPLSVAAGLACLRTMLAERTVDYTNMIGAQVREGLKRLFAERRIAAQVTGLGSLFHVHFTREPVHSARPAEDADHALIVRLHERLLAHGIYFYSGRLGFLSAAHSGDDIGYTLDAMAECVDRMLADGEFDLLRT